jgi:transcriptional regulator with PAS, ATPase and Fis domain
MNLINKTNEEIINIVKSKEAFGCFFIDLKYRNDTLRQRLKNISNKTKKLIPVYSRSGITYYYNPFYDTCLELNTLTFKQVCKRFTNKYQNTKDWTVDNLQTIINATPIIIN